MLSNFEIVIFSILGLWIFTASLFDIKNREVPDWLSFSLISIGLSSRLIYSLVSWNFWEFLYGVFGLIIGLIIGIIMSYTKQWGDGDSKLLIGIGCCLGFSFSFSITNLSSWPILIYFFINSIVVSAFYGIFYAAVMIIKHWKNFVFEFKKINRIFLLGPLGLLILIIIASLFFSGSFRILLIIMGIIATFGLYLLVIIKVLEIACMYKETVVSKLVPGDWIARNVVVGKRIICSVKDRCLDERQIALLKKYKVKKVLVKEGIPFVPSFFLGFLVSVIFGNLLSYIF